MGFYDNMPSNGSSQIGGILVGTVIENYDKDHLGMIKVSYSFGQKGKNTSGWIPVTMPYVASAAGSYFFPEVGSDVVVGFIMGNLNKPIVLGSLWNESTVKPEGLDYEKNTIKKLRTKAGHEVVFDETDSKEAITITSKGGSNIKILDENQQIILSDKDSKNTIKMDLKSGAISLDAEKKLELKIGGTAVITVESNALELKSGGVNVTASQGLTLKGQTANLQGSTVELKADASMKVNASGILEVKGSMVKLN